jgi:hypothetical protein
MKNLKVKSAVVLLSVLASGSAAFAQATHGGDRQGADFVASANISGTEEKGLVAKSTVGHYTVCNSGHHVVSITHDGNSSSVGSGDCMAIEAKTVTAAGTDDDARNSVTVSHHSHQ